MESCDEIRENIENLLPELKWKILSYLPQDLLNELNLSNKQAWILLNLRNTTSLVWNDAINWIDKLNCIELILSTSLFVFTMSDLHNHMEEGNHHCFCLNTTKGDCLQFIPVPDVDGFILKNEKCKDIPWSKYSYVFNSRTEFRMPASVLTGTYHDGNFRKWSPVFRLLERELQHDPCVKNFFESVKKRESFYAESGEEHDDIIDSFCCYTNGLDYECSTCSESSSSSESENDIAYSPPTTDECSSDDDTCSDMEISCDELIFLKDEIIRLVAASQQERSKQHKEELLKKMARSKGPEAMDDIFSREPYRAIKTVFCHNFNNFGSCHYGQACKFKHEIAPVCTFDLKCTRRNCGYYHNPKPSHSEQTMLEQADIIDVILNENNNNGKSENDKNSIGESGSQNNNNIVKSGVKDIQIVREIISDLSIRSKSDLVSVEKETFMEIDELEDTEEKNGGVKSCQCDELQEEDDQDCEADDEEEKDNIDTLLWNNFVTEIKSKSNLEFQSELKNAKREKYNRKRAKHNEKHPLPPEWENRGFPDYNSFPLLFFLTSHPKNVNKVHLKYRMERKNCIIWKVFETLCKRGNEYEEQIGLAVIPCTSTGLPRLPICCGDQAAVGLFGTDEMLAIGMFELEKGREQNLLDGYDDELPPDYMNFHYRYDLEG